MAVEVGLVFGDGDFIAFSICVVGFWISFNGSLDQLRPDRVFLVELIHYKPRLECKENTCRF